MGDLNPGSRLHYGKRPDLLQTDRLRERGFLHRRFGIVPCCRGCAVILRAADVVLDPTRGLERRANAIQNPQERLSVHIIPRFEHTLRQSSIKRGRGLNPRFAIEDERLLREERMLMWLKDAGRVTKTVHPRSDRDQDLLTVAAGLRADNEQM